MKYWIEVKNPWSYKQFKDSINLSKPEKNINIDLSELSKNKKKEIILIFTGDKRFYNNHKKNDFIDMLTELKRKGVIDFSKTKISYVKKLSQSSKSLIKVRKSTISSSGPISDIYKLDINNSKFIPQEKFIFNAKYFIKSVKGRLAYNWSSGIDEKEELAELKAIMEGIERYASSVIPNNLIRTSARKLGKQSINPNKLVSYSQQQYLNKDFPLAQFSFDKDYYWKEVVSYFNEKKMYVPAECIYYPLNNRFIEKPFTHSNSSGVAAGFTVEEAIHRGVYEIIERDSFMIVWVNRLRVSKLSKKSLPLFAQERLMLIEQTGFTPFILNLTLDLVPVILAVAISYDPPLLIMGAAANLVAENAIHKAINELELGLFWELREYKKNKRITHPYNVKSAADHVFLYKSKKYIKRAEFLLKGAESAFKEHGNSKNSNFDTLVNLISNRNLELLFADITPKSLKHAGIKVFRSFLPSMIPISFGYGMEPLGMPRIKKIPTGLSSEAKRWQNTLLPHPFP